MSEIGEGLRCNPQGARKNPLRAEEPPSVLREHALPGLSSLGRGDELLRALVSLYARRAAGLGLGAAEFSAAIEELERHRARIKREEFEAEIDAVCCEYGTYRVSLDATSGVVRFYFPGAPSKAAQRLLESTGFAWNPAAWSWERDLSEGGARAAEAVRAGLDQLAEDVSGGRGVKAR